MTSPATSSTAVAPATKTYDVPRHVEARTRSPGASRARPLGTVADVDRPLAIVACRSSCAWQETEEILGSERVFAGPGSGSGWAPSEPWTPIDWTGAVPEAVQRARRAARGGG